MHQAPGVPARCCRQLGDVRVSVKSQGPLFTDCNAYALAGGLRHTCISSSQPASNRGVYASVE
eukprot:3761043-Rhodomonas_salina.1